MKIEITIEVDDIRIPPPGASWETRTDYGDTVLRSIVSWAEKQHYGWQAARIVADGDEAWKWEQGRATPKQIKEMRRQVVMDALTTGVDNHIRQYNRLGEDYKRIMDEYLAGAPWVKRVVGSVKGSIRRRQKQHDEQQARMEAQQSSEQTKLALVRAIVKDEDLNQKVLEAQGGTRVSVTRIKEMTLARITGRGEFDPRPDGPDEERLWGRISRAVEAQATFDPPSRYYGHVSDDKGGHVSINWTF